ncbi:DUF342 domain-containing protein [Leptospira sp. GIMC2001]|uniref:DUF342 domain-containing protein n=1 Tax=Leptospira sp. GIMC2001 TaxID=1513297 RepID=UPI002349B0E7|nr:FapA family protein [Leptospira sp. GIMC2001]WCL50211.1 FapA family protein [Leptospira sp. GIMC2001]
MDGKNLKDSNSDGTQSTVAMNPFQAAQAQEYNLDRGMNVEVSNDNLLATLVVKPSWLVGKEATVTDISLTFERFSIPENPNNYEKLQKVVAEINKVLASKENLTKVLHFPVAEGIPAKPGVDGWIKFNFPRAQRVVIKEDGSADFRNIERFVHVKQGEQVASHFEGIPGESGLDVFGKTIHAPAIKRPKLIVGKNVSFNEQHDPDNEEYTIKVYYATCNGVIFTTDNSVTVSPELNIETDVGLETGNINFDGTIRVQGSIVDGSKLVCKASLFVNGNVESMDVEVAETLDIKGGIKGRDRNKGLLKVNGDLHAKFIENANIEVAGDLIVENYILNSKILCLGSVFVTADAGSIISSDLLLYNGLSVANLGSNAQLDTTIEVGFHYRNDRLFNEGIIKLKNYENELENLEPKIIKIKEAVTRSRGKLDDSKKAEFKEIFEDYTKRKKVIELFTQKLEYLKTQRFNPDNVKVVIRHLAFPGVTLKYRRQLEKISKQQSSFMLNFFPNQDKAVMVAWKQGK